VTDLAKSNNPENNEKLRRSCRTRPATIAGLICNSAASAMIAFDVGFRNASLRRHTDLGMRIFACALICFAFKRFGLVGLLDILVGYCAAIFIVQVLPRVHEFMHQREPEII